MVGSNRVLKHKINDVFASLNDNTIVFILVENSYVHCFFGDDWLGGNSKKDLFYVTILKYETA